MATLGKNVIGLTELVASNTPYVSGPYLASEDGTIDTISVYTATTGVNLRLAVYLHDEANLRPSTLIASPRTDTRQHLQRMAWIRLLTTGLVETLKL